MRQHAKPGDKVKILDDNKGNWVKVGQVYYVLEVSDPNGDEEQRLYVFDGVDESWFGEPQHFEIINKRSARMHQNYRKFSEGDVVIRWRDIEDWEWDGIGEIDIPDIGEEVKVGTVDMGSSHKEVSFHIKDIGWVPMKAFVLATYYKKSTTTITNRGTADLNTEGYGEINTNPIEVQRPLASIITGKRSPGGGVQGRGNATSIRVGHLSHKEIFGW